MTSPDHLDLNFPRNSFSLGLKIKTLSPTLNSFLTKFLLCHFFVFSLYIFSFSYESLRISSSSFSCRSLLSLASLRSKLRFLIAYIALCFNSKGKWHDFLKINQKGDMPIGVLKAVLYSYSASSNLFDQSFLYELTVLSNIALISRFEISACPLDYG